MRTKKAPYCWHGARGIPAHRVEHPQGEAGCYDNNISITIVNFFENFQTISELI
jgi:hypothetical protein